MSSLKTYLKGPTALTPKMNSIDCAASTRARTTCVFNSFSISQMRGSRLTGPSWFASLSRSFPLPSLLCFHSLRASLTILPAQNARVSHPAPPPYPACPSSTIVLPAVTANAESKIFENGVGRVGCLGDEEVKRRDGLGIEKVCRWKAEWGCMPLYADSYCVEESEMKQVL
jgi:hypothetical protein